MFVDIDAAGCTDTCRHCSVDGHAPYGAYYSLEELRALRQEWGPLTIRFEPTAHPGFPEIYAPDIATEHGGWLVTNGFGMAQREDYRSMLGKMQALGITTLAFTLHGLRAHHDWFVCRKGAFDDLVTATRRAKAAGFALHWQVFVDRRGIGDTAALVDLSLQEIGAVPLLTIPYHRVGGRLRHYAALRPTLGEVEKHHLQDLIQDPQKNDFAQAAALTARSWLEKWKTSPQAEDFKHPYEPLTWPPQVSFPMLSLRIDRRRKVLLDPMCHAPIPLGTVADGKDAILARLSLLTMPLHADLDPGEVRLVPEEQEQLHPSGFSLRYQEISKLTWGPQR